MSTHVRPGVGILPYTWAGAPGVGPSRERALWAAGGWDHARMAEAADRAGLGKGALHKLLGFTQDLHKHMDVSDPVAIFRMLPTRERWRVLPMVLHRSVGVDIETDGNHVTALAVFGPGVAAAWAPGLGDPPLDALESAQAILSFNGGAFDLPILSSAWPGIRWPAIHLDVLSMTRRMNLKGGLKSLEKQAGWTRPDRIDGVSGAHAVGLWQAWALARDVGALEKLLEYNLEDALSLSFLAAWCHDRLVQRVLSAAPGAPRPGPLGQSPLGLELTRPSVAPMATRALMDAMARVPRPG